MGALTNARKLLSTASRIALGLGMLAKLQAAEPTRKLAATEASDPAVVVDLDGVDGNPATNRHLLPCSVQAVFSRDLGGDNIIGNYRVKYSVIDAGGNPIKFATANPDPFVGHSAPFFVSLKDPETALSISVPFEFQPAGAMSPQRGHQVLCQLQEEVGAAWVDVVGGDDTSGDFSALHFTNTNSGDASWNIQGSVTEVSWDTTSAMFGGIPGGFQVTAKATVGRFDDFQLPVDQADSQLRWDFDLIEVGSGAQIALYNDGIVDQGYKVDSYELDGGVPCPVVEIDRLGGIVLVPLEQLDSVNETYRLVCTLSHLKSDGQSFRELSSFESDAVEVMHFNGTLTTPGGWGIEAEFSELGLDPLRGAEGVGYVETQIVIPPGSGSFPQNADLGFGKNAAITVRLEPDGDAVLHLGSFEVTRSDGSGEAWSQDLSGYGIEFGALSYSTGGLQAADASVSFPQGVVLMTTENQRTTRRGEASFVFSGANGSPSPSFPLDENGGVAVDLVSTLPAGTQVASEEFPVLTEVSALTLTLAGRLEFTPVAVEYVHEEALTILENDALAGIHEEAGMEVRRTNDGYFRFLSGVLTDSLDFIVASDGSSRLEGEFGISPGSFEPHFPLETEVSWPTVTSRLSLAHGEPADSSVVHSPDDVSLSYLTTCPNDRCAAEGAGEVGYVLQSLLGEMRFTDGGGLLMEGALPVADKIEWGARGDGAGGVGDPTHEVFAGGYGVFFMPGQHLYAGDNTAGSSPWLGSQASDQGPDLLLNAVADIRFGTSRTNIYGSTEHTSGLRNYAGVNFPSPDDQALSVSRLGGGEMEYHIESPSKYYVRYSGVTGRHLAEPGSYEPTTIYGYGFDFSKFQLTFLSSEPRQSRVNGQLAVTGATTFTQQFTNLMLSCTGDLGPARIDPTDLGDKPLIYWGGQFTPHRMTFQLEEAADCEAPDGQLVFGSSIQMSNVPVPLHGPIAIEADGRLTTIASAYGNVDSRFDLPARLTYGAEGPAQYSVVPSGKLYFNNPEEAEISGPGVPSGGFATFGCSIDVPYFRNLMGQAITYPAGLDSVSPDSLLYLAGGWNEAGETFFSSVAFDPTCQGWPKGRGFDFHDYREPDESLPDQYLLAARQKMFGLVDLDYPLRWDAAGAFFESMENRSNNFLVLEMNHEVGFLDAEFADISFGASYDGLPRIRLTDVLNDQVNAVSESMVGVLEDGVKETIDGGLEAFDRILADTLEDTLEGAIDRVEFNLTNILYQDIAFSYQAARQHNLDIEAGILVGPPRTFGNWFEEDLDDILDTMLITDLLNEGEYGAGLLLDQLQGLGDGIEASESFLAEVDGVLEDLVLMIDGLVNQLRSVDGELSYEEVPVDIPAQEIVRGLLQEYVPNNEDEPGRWLFVELVRTLLVESTPEEIRVIIEPLLLNEASEISRELIALFEEIEPALARLVANLNAVRAVLLDLRAQLEEGGALVTNIENLVASATLELRQISGAVRERAESLVRSVAASSGVEMETDIHLGTELFVTAGFEFENSDLGQERFVRELSATLRNELLNSELVNQFRFRMRQVFAELEVRVMSAIQSLFSQANEVMAGVIKEALGGVEAEFNEFLGEAGEFIGAGDLEGFARIRGDSLRQLRLDGDFQFHVPDEMELHAYMEINNVTAEDNFTGNGCLSPGQRAVEIKVGATDVGLDWFAEDMRARLVELRVSLKDFAGDPFAFPVPNGMGGTFDISGEFDFQGFDVSDIGATFGLAVDPEHPINSECYLGGGASMSLSGYGVTGAIFLGRTCTLEPLELVDPQLAELLGSAPFTGGYLYGEVHLPLSEALLGIPASCLFQISADIGAGAFFFVEGPTFGGKLAAGISGEALCAVSIGGKVNMIGVMEGGSLKYSGTGTVKGKAGYCPFCLKFSKSIKVTYHGGDWSVDL